MARIMCMSTQSCSLFQKRQNYYSPNGRLTLRPQRDPNMAKVVITIEDSPDGNSVKVEATPKMETMFLMLNSGHELTPAQGYAFKALNAMRVASREQGPNRILVPRIGRA